MIASPDVGPNAARSRHPSVRAPLSLDCLRDRVADALEHEGVRWPDVAAGVLETRGRTGLGVVAFARRAGVDPDILRRAEAGELSGPQLPGALRRMVPR